MRLSSDDVWSTWADDTSGRFGVRRRRYTVLEPSVIIEVARPETKSRTTVTKEDRMAAKAEALATQFEAKVQEATAVLERLTDADWQKTTSGEKWTVGVVAHHVAGSHEGIAGIIKSVASGQSMGNFTMEMLHEMNAKHAKEHARASRAETVALHKKGAAAAAAVVRGLSDADLGKSATVLAGMPAMSVEQIVNTILINHVNDHFASIKATVGV
jgi:hypothetical protein